MRSKTTQIKCKVFCDVRVFDHNALRYSRTELKKCFQKNEEEKKKSYNERVLQIENATFTPLVFSANGGMGKECSTFYKRLAEMIADKRNIATSEAISFVRTRISFSFERESPSRYCARCYYDYVVLDLTEL